MARRKCTARHGIALHYTKLSRMLIWFPQRCFQCIVFRCWFFPHFYSCLLFCRINTFKLPKLTFSLLMVKLTLSQDMSAINAKFSFAFIFVFWVEIFIPPATAATTTEATQIFKHILSYSGPSKHAHGCIYGPVNLGAINFHRLRSYHFYRATKTSTTWNFSLNSSKRIRCFLWSSFLLNYHKPFTV